MNDEIVKKEIDLELKRVISILFLLVILTACTKPKYDFKVDKEVIDGLTNVSEEQLHQGVYLPMILAVESRRKIETYENEFLSLDGMTGLIFNINPNKDPKRISEAQKQIISQEVQNETSNLEMKLSFYEKANQGKLYSNPLYLMSFDLGIPYRKKKDLRNRGSESKLTPKEEWYLFYIKLDSNISLENATEKDVKITFVTYKNK